MGEHSNLGSVSSMEAQVPRTTLSGKARAASAGLLQVVMGHASPNGSNLPAADSRTAQDETDPCSRPSCATYSCVAWGKSLNLSMPQSLHVYNRPESSTHR